MSRKKYKYSTQVQFGYGPDGKRIRKRFSADTKVELNAKIEQYKESLRRASNPSEITFGVYSEKWKETYKQNRSQKTQDMYDYALTKCSALDGVAVCRITKTMCQAIINEVWDKPSTARQVHLTLYQVFKAAINDGIILKNPAAGVEIPKAKKKEIYLMTDADLEAVRKAKLNPKDRMFVEILMVFGLRPGEALALKSEDFDIRRKILHITKSLELLDDGSSLLKETKTGVSRDIPVPKQIIPHLKAYFKDMKGDYMFPKEDGNLFTKSAYRKMSVRIANRIIEAGGPKITMYQFRHRRATDLYYLTQKGTISVKKASSLLGHSEEVFLSTYAHIDEEKEDVSKLYAGLKL
ncbi:MAG: site-specific integrase [Lachnospiraceae bacterium]|nr:site-specific integrase [Lachnospiraceae bacterium]